ncbi:phosphatase PAP2 family protein [Wenyingzhuangia sp. IMCC45533]
MERLKIFILIASLTFYSKVNAQSAIERIGDYGLYSLPVIALGTTVLEKDFKGSKMFAKSGAANLAITFGLKALIEKERPNGENLKSFPSAHTSITFQSAAFIQRRYGWKYAVPMYIMAGYTGFSRVHVKKHFIEDVLAGASIGVLSSYLFTRKRKVKRDTYFSFGKKGSSYAIVYKHTF